MSITPKRRPLTSAVSTASGSSHARSPTRSIAEFVSATGYVTVAERPLNPDDYPDAPPENLVAGLDGVHPHRRAGRPAPPQPVVDLDAGRVLEPPPGPAVIAAQAAMTTPSCTSPSKTPRPTRTGRDWRFPARRSGRWPPAAASPAPVHLGRGTRGTRPAAGQLLARRVSVLTRDRLWHNETGRQLSPERLWSLRHGRQCLGMDHRLVWPTTGRPRPAALPKADDPAQPQFKIPRKVIKGGSFLCADSYCMRYRPAARRPQMVDTGMSHIGFRCVSTPDGPLDESE